MSEDDALLTGHDDLEIWKVRMIKGSCNRLKNREAQSSGSCWPSGKLSEKEISCIVPGLLSPFIDRRFRIKWQASGLTPLPAVARR